MTQQAYVAKVDYENNGEVWWSAFTVALTAGHPVATTMAAFWQGHDEVAFADKDDFAAARDFASGLPGWTDGPAHAPHPVIFSAGDNA